MSSPSVRPVGSEWREGCRGRDTGSGRSDSSTGGAASLTLVSSSRNLMSLSSDGTRVYVRLPNSELDVMYLCEWMSHYRPWLSWVGGERHKVSADDLARVKSRALDYTVSRTLTETPTKHTVLPHLHVLLSTTKYISTLVQSCITH